MGRVNIYGKYVRIKGGQAKRVRLRTRGEGGGGLILTSFVRMYYVDDPHPKLNKKYTAGAK